MLLLKQANKSRPIDQWSDTDYDVWDGNQHIGRIIWSITARVPQGPYDRGYAATREEAMTDFKARWERKP